MGRTDNEKLKTLFSIVDPLKVQLHQVNAAKAEIEQFDAKAISDISFALGQFFNFVSDNLWFFFSFYDLF